MPLRIAALDRLMQRRAPGAVPAAADGDEAVTPTTTTAPPSHPRRPPPHHHHHHPRPRHQHKQRPPPPPGFGPRDDARSFFAGTLGFGALAYVAGAAPWALHLVFLVFFFTALPLRAYSFWRRRWQFFLIDYCYLAACAAAAFLLFAPDDARAEAAAYALTEGPLAAALAAWQCRLQFGSLEHTVSTHLHLLPGLAVVAHRYAAPSGVRGWRAIAGHLCATAREAGEAAALGLLPARAPVEQRSWSPWTGTVVASSPSGAAPPPTFRLFRPPEGPLPPAPAPFPEPVLLWAVAAPLALYCAWQLAYFFTVQVLFRELILREKYDTSYTCLARRAQKSNNVWNRLVRRGGALRRCAAYGALQLAFTVASVVGLALPAYLLGARAGALVQVFKIAIPLWYGARWQCEFGAPRRQFEAGVRWARQQQGVQPEQEVGGTAGGLEQALSDGVTMAAGMGSGEGARDAVASAEDGDGGGDEATSGLRGRAAAGRGRGAAAFEPLLEGEEEQEEGEAPRAWGGEPVARLLQRRRPRRPRPGEEEDGAGGGGGA